MRILYITQSYPPMISGAALVVARLAQGMAARGHTIKVIAASDQGQAYVDWQKQIKIVRLKSMINPQRAHQHFVPWAQRQIRTEIRNFQPDLIHIHDPLVLGMATIWQAKLDRIPVITTIHLMPWFIRAYLPESPRMQSAIENLLWCYSRWLNRQSRIIIVPTETIARAVETNGGYRPTAISNGVDLQRFSPDRLSNDHRQRLYRKYALDPNLPIILHVGRLDLDKQVKVVLQAACKAIKTHPAQLLIVGDGAQRQALINLARWAGIDRHCRFPGFIAPGDELADLYRLADVFVVASEIETQGLVLLEALACGLPVVAVRATCIPEIVHDDVNGYLVQPRNVDSLGERIVDVLTNPIKARQMSVAGRAVAQSHSVTKCIQQHAQLYHEVIGATKTSQCASERSHFPAIRRFLKRS